MSYDPYYINALDHYDYINRGNSWIENDVYIDNESENIYTYDQYVVDVGYDNPATQDNWDDVERRGRKKQSARIGTYNLERMQGDEQKRKNAEAKKFREDTTRIKNTRLPADHTVTYDNLTRVHYIQTDGSLTYVNSHKKKVTIFNEHFKNVPRAKRTFKRPMPAPYFYRVVGLHTKNSGKKHGPTAPYVVVLSIEDSLVTFAGGTPLHFDSLPPPDRSEFRGQQIGSGYVEYTWLADKKKMNRLAHALNGNGVDGVRPKGKGKVVNAHHCYSCGKVGHNKSKCPTLNNKQPEEDAPVLGIGAEDPARDDYDLCHDPKCRTSGVHGSHYHMKEKKNGDNKEPPKSGPERRVAEKLKKEKLVLCTTKDCLLNDPGRPHYHAPKFTANPADFPALPPSANPNRPTPDSDWPDYDPEDWVEARGDGAGPSELHLVAPVATRADPGHEYAPSARPAQTDFRLETGFTHTAEYGPFLRVPLAPHARAPPTASAHRPDTPDNDDEGQEEEEDASDEDTAAHEEPPTPAPPGLLGTVDEEPEDAAPPQQRLLSSIRNFQHHRLQTVKKDHLIGWHAETIKNRRISPALCAVPVMKLFLSVSGGAITFTLENRTIFHRPDTAAEKKTSGLIAWFVRHFGASQTQFHGTPARADALSSRVASRGAAVTTTSLFWKNNLVASGADLQAQDEDVFQRLGYTHQREATVCVEVYRHCIAARVFAGTQFVDREGKVLIAPLNRIVRELSNFRGVKELISSNMLVYRDTITYIHNHFIKLNMSLSTLIIDNQKAPDFHRAGQPHPGARGSPSSE